MLTLTYDPKRYTSLESWLRHYTDMAQFVKLFRKDFKQHNPQSLWVCEKHRDGRPHVHCNIYLDKQIQQYPTSKDWQYRKFVFDNYHYYVKSTWQYGLTDICAFYKDGLLHGLRYPLKYLFKARLKSPDWLKLLLESQEPSTEPTTSKEPLTEDPTGYMGQDGLYHTSFMPSPSSKWWINKQTTLDTIGFDGNIHVTQGAPSAWEHMLEKQRSHKNRPSEYIKLRMWRQSLGWPKLFTEEGVII